jgi:hypothetical protein
MITDRQHYVTRLVLGITGVPGSSF